MFLSILILILCAILFFSVFGLFFKILVSGIALGIKAVSFLLTLAVAAAIIYGVYILIKKLINN